MALESGSFLDDLVATNPAAGDPVNQGDDHIRLLKSVLKGTFPGLTKAVDLTEGGTIRHGAIELGHASDTTLTRLSSGQPGVEGVPLAKFETGTFTPTFTFATPGNLSVSYSNQLGRYTKIGNRVFLNFTMTWTPTYSSASGVASFGGLPFNTVNVSAAFYGAMFALTRNIVFDADMRQLAVDLRDNQSVFSIKGIRSGNNESSLTTTHFPSGVEFWLTLSLFYEV